MISGITTGSKDLRIIGIDPGTTSAVAVLDLDGELVGYRSAKNFSKDQIIQFIVSHGPPLIIGSDVSPIPSLIEDVASNMGAVRSVPSEDLQASYKDRLTDRFDAGRMDAHTTDALAAAEYAYREFGDTIDTLRERAEQAELDAAQTRTVIEQVLKQGVSTAAAINNVQKNEQSDEPDTPDDTGEPRSQQDWKPIAEKRKEKIDLLEDKITHLEEYIRMLENDTGTDPGVSQDELKRRNREINTLRSKVEEKQSRIEQLQGQNQALQRALHRVLEHNWLHVPRVDSLQQTEEDIVYCDTYSGGEVSNTVDTVVTTSSLQQTAPYQSLQEKGIDVISLSTLDDPVQLDAGYVVDPEQALRTGESEKFMEWLESYRKRQTMQ